MRVSLLLKGRREEGIPKSPEKVWQFIVGHQHRQKDVVQRSPTEL